MTLKTDTLYKTRSGHHAIILSTETLEPTGTILWLRGVVHLRNDDAGILLTTNWTSEGCISGASHAEARSYDLMEEVNDPILLALLQSSIRLPR